MSFGITIENVDGEVKVTSVSATEYVPDKITISGHVSLSGEPNSISVTTSDGLSASSSASVHHRVDAGH